MSAASQTSAAPSPPAEPPRDCARCPRLVAYREENARAEPDWFNAPVPSFGSDDARLLVVGLAPGRGGANRTGRPFTGDYAGDVLYPALLAGGFARGAYDARPDDGLTLAGCMITNAVRCVPPQNKPTGAEARACRDFLKARIASLPKLAVILALGRVAHDNTCAALGLRAKDAPFGHGAAHAVRANDGPVTLIDSYHTSRYNLNTRVLTHEMFAQVITQARALVDAADASTPLAH